MCDKKEGAGLSSLCSPARQLPPLPLQEHEVSRQGPCTWSKLPGTLSASIRGFTQQLSRLRGEREILLVSWGA